MIVTVIVHENGQDEKIVSLVGRRLESPRFDANQPSRRVTVDDGKGHSCGSARAIR